MPMAVYHDRQRILKLTASASVGLVSLTALLTKRANGGTNLINANDAYELAYDIIRAADEAQKYDSRVQNKAG